MFGCFFGHRYKIKKFEELHIRYCARCGNEEILTPCDLNGHRWKEERRWTEYCYYLSENVTYIEQRCQDCGKHGVDTICS